MSVTGCEKALKSQNLGDQANNGGGKKNLFRSRWRWWWWGSGGGSGGNHEEQGDIKSAFISKFSDLERLNKGPQKDSDGVALPGGGEGWIMLTIGWTVENGHSHGHV